MKFVVVGASGFIGGHILKAARTAGCAAIGTQSRPRGGELLPFDLRTDRLRDRVPAGWFGGTPRTVVVVAAAVPQLDQCRREPVVSFETNVTGTVRALQDASDAGAVPVFLSSSFVFDGRRGQYGDRDPRTPSSEYGRHKAQVEEIIETSMPTALVLRLDKTIGDDPAEKHMLSEWWTLAQQGGPIRCIQDQVFSPTLVDDVARGVLLACRSELTGIYNLAGPEPYGRADLAEKFVRRTGLPVRVTTATQQELGFADLRPERSSLDSSALMRATGLTFTTMDTVFESFLRKAGQPT